VSASKSPTYPQDEPGTPQDDAECDADEDADGRGVECPVDQEPDDHATDDTTDEEPAEADEVATS
jgi:hypothetical protein